MLHPVEILPGARRSLRRAVELHADIVATGWDAPRRHRVLDLSPEGLRVAAGTLLAGGEHAIVCFTPPGWWLLDEIVAWARVARAVPRCGSQQATMALELMDLSSGMRVELERALEGRPPPLPRRYSRSIRRELVWVDSLVCEISLSESELDPAPLGDLLTGGGARYEWRHAPLIHV